MNGPAIVVPGNGMLARDGAYRISRSCKRLVAEAERLAGRRSARLVAFSGWAPDGGPSEAEQMRALWRGPAVELVAEETATTTAENAARTLPILLARGVRAPPTARRRSRAATARRCSRWAPPRACASASPPATAGRSSTATRSAAG